MAQGLLVSLDVAFVIHFVMEKGDHEMETLRVNLDTLISAILSKSTITNRGIEVK